MKSIHLIFAFLLVSIISFTTHVNSGFAEPYHTGKNIKLDKEYKSKSFTLNQGMVTYEQTAKFERKNGNKYENISYTVCIIPAKETNIDQGCSHGNGNLSEPVVVDTSYKTQKISFSIPKKDRYKLILWKTENHGKVYIKKYSIS